MKEQQLNMIKPGWIDLFHNHRDDKGNSLTRIKTKMKITDARTCSNGIFLEGIESARKTKVMLLLLSGGSSALYHSMIFALFETIGLEIELTLCPLSIEKQVYVIPLADQIDPSVFAE